MNQFEKKRILKGLYNKVVLSNNGSALKKPLKNDSEPRDRDAVNLIRLISEFYDNPTN